jgi:hypothetical protein
MKAERILWDEYKATWEAFSRSLDRLQTCAEAGDKEAIGEALLALERAKAAHNSARDKLAAELSDEIAASDAGTGAELTDDEPRIRQQAHLLWELSGKPQGTAETDWLRAERLVRSASV